MSAKKPRTFLLLLCVLIILSSSSEKSYRQAFSAASPGSAPDAEISGAGADEQPEAIVIEPERDTSENPEAEQEPPEANSGALKDLEAELPQIQDEELLREWGLESAQEPDTEYGGENTPGYGISATAYSLESNERVVKTFAELKDALASNNGVTTVHLGGDIVMQGGVGINSGKPHVTIDGFDPTNPAQTEPYTLTDLDSALFTDTVYVSSSSVSYVHVRDLKIIGKNYYGPFSVTDSSSMSKVKLIFERVDYNGPQLGYHRQGTIYIVDCKVRLHSGNGICSSQEFSEAKGLIFEGENTIETDTASYSVFWHPLGGVFTVADDSSVTLISPNTSGIYGVFYADGPAYDIDITVGRRAVFNSVILNSVAAPANVAISSLTVREGGEFSLTTTGVANRDVLSIDGEVTVEPDASFIINSFGGNYPAMSLRTGDITVGKDAVFHIISSNSNSSLLNLYGRSFICNDPASVLLYNPGGRDISASSNPGGIYIDAEQVNYWNAPSAGGLDNPPLYRWKKDDGSNIRIEGTLSTGANGGFGAIESNYGEGDSPGTPPDNSAFNMTSARVIAFGRLELMVGAPTTASSEIAGVTAPGAVVRASLYQQGTNYAMPDAISGPDGVFAIPIDMPLQYLTDVTVISCYRYLTASRTITAGDAGSLTFTVPSELRFYTEALSAKPQAAKRLDPGWQLVVSDTRGTGATWSVYVREVQPLTPMDSSKPPLKNSLVFADDTGVVTPLGASGALLVYRHTTAPDSETVSIGWDAGHGILARIPTGAAYIGQLYSGVIEWSLIDAP